MSATGPPDGASPSSRPGQRTARIACVAGIVGKSVFALVVLPTTPSLLGTHPVVLEALRGSVSAMASAGAFARVGQASLVLALLAPLPTLLFTTPFFWWAGRLWGPGVAATVTGGHPRAQRWAEDSSARLRRHGGAVVALAPYLPVPAALIDAAAGWTGMTFRRFMFFDVLGILSWIGLIVGLGYAIGRPAVRIAQGISHYGLVATIALVVIAVGVGAIRGRRTARQIWTPPEP